MKTIETEREITATETDTTYQCDQCEHSSDSEEEMLNHEGIKHSYTESKEIDGDTYFKFADEAGFNRYTAWKATDSHNSIDAKWKGPGWYREHYETRPRGCGCGCQDDFTCLRPAGDFIASMRARAARLTALADEIAKMTSTS